jgi:tRNA A-37 threonylcarbamoyl transferase component Bud32/tetratricopeptide (TPR) repeat protein
VSNNYQLIFSKAGEFANLGQYLKAGRFILDQLGLSLDKLSSINSQEKKLIYLAATYFNKAGDNNLAVELYLALGERHKAADLLEKSGDLIAAEKVRNSSGSPEPVSIHQKRAIGGVAVNRYTAKRLEQEGKIDLAIKAYFQLHEYKDAGRLLRSQHKLEEAANMFAEGGYAFDAASCFLEIGDTGKGLDNLIRVPRDHPQYRKAALKAIAVAIELNVLNFKIDNFLSEFINTGPQNRQELEGMFQLAGLYERHDLLENAKEVLTKIQKVSPGYRDTDKQLVKLNRFSRASGAVYEKIRAQEASFRGEKRRIDPNAVLQAGATPLPGLPPLPDLPGLNAEKGEKKSEKQNSEANEYRAFNVGNLIAGRYLLEAEIGIGGMAVIFKANDNELDEQIALKVFLSRIRDPELLRESEDRFKQELKLSRKLRHKNIISLYDIGMHNGHRYISMELLKGSDLEKKIETTTRPLDFKYGIDLLIQACNGLHAAHEKGVVHRDIKPENIFVTNDNVIKIMDFGIAKNTVTKGVTIEGMVAGTPHYIAPEQVSSFSKVTPLADLYSLGLVAYKMFTRTLPFDDDDLTRLMMMHINDQPESPRAINPSIPKELEYVILRLLSKDPLKRFKNALELARYFAEIKKRLKY